MREGKTSICADCLRAAGGCSWSRRLQPVEGWTAEPSELHKDGYWVTECPRYVRGKRHLDLDDIPDAAICRLARAMFERAAKDYSGDIQYQEGRRPNNHPKVIERDCAYWLELVGYDASDIDKILKNFNKEKETET